MNSAASAVFPVMPMRISVNWPDWVGSLVAPAGVGALITGALPAAVQALSSQANPTARPTAALIRRVYTRAADLRLHPRAANASAGASVDRAHRVARHPES